MKNTENSAAMKKVVALLLVTCIVIGLVSSTGIKLVAATYYMQTKKKLATSNPGVNKVIGLITGDDELITGTTAAPTEPATQTPAPAPVTPPPTTEETTEETTTETTTEETTVEDTTIEETSEESTSEESTSATTESTTAADSGSGDILGALSGLLGSFDLGSIDLGSIGDSLGGIIGGLIPEEESTTETTTETTTESAESIKQKENILVKYNSIVNYAKTVGKPAFTKVTYRSLDTGKSLLFKSVESAYPEYFISKDNAEAAPIVVPGNSDTSEFLIDNEYFAGMLAKGDAAKAIASATNEDLEDGTKKITIVLREEVDPAITEPSAKKPASFTSAMFPVIGADVVKEKVAPTLKLVKANSASVKYEECTVELVYDPSIGVDKIISIKQTTKHVDTIDGYIISEMLPVSASATVTEVSEYRDFDYGLI